MGGQIMSDKIAKYLEEMYDLGFTDGYKAAKRQMALEKFEKDVAELNNEAKGFLERQYEKAEEYRDSLREEGIDGTC
jgi:flagellar biosynthesis/type III secretory pathway protein FliH